MAKELTRSEEIERSIIKKYRKELWNPFTYAVNHYELIKPGDSVAVCISGGKDSMLLSKLMQELHRHTAYPFEVKYLVMDPGYSPENRRKIEENLELLNVPAVIFESSIFEAADNTEKNPCYLCARMRRGALYAKAKELGCNKIALGHHFNDVIETTLMALLFGAQLQGMMPKLHSANFPGMELIRPLYCVHEEDIVAWARYNDLRFIRCACKLTEGAETGELVSKRRETKELIAKLKKTSPNVEKSIFNAIHELALDTFPAYKTRGVEHSFLERYDEKKE